MPLDVAAIQANGWRQGALFSVEATRQLIGADQADSSRLILASQDCDVVHPGVHEPHVDVFVASPVDRLSSLETKGRNARRLRLMIDLGDQRVPHEIKFWSRITLERQRLCEFTADKEAILSGDALAAFRRWLGLRYTRLGLPDAFNRRLGGNNGQKKLREIFEPDESCFAQIFLWMDPESEELPDGVPYRIRVVLVMRELDTHDKDRVDRATFVRERLVEFVEQLDGIELSNEGVEIMSDEDFTLADLETFFVWDFTDLSLPDNE
jgi:hypothetical protein